jgi:hypothetical protein
MKMPYFRSTCLILLAPLEFALSCSSDCAPVSSGGVVVTVTVASSCDAISIVATDGSNQYAIDATTAIESEGGVVCEFQGLTGHPGTFDLQLIENGQPTASQSVTLNKLDECNVSGKQVTFDASAP